MYKRLTVMAFFLVLSCKFTDSKIQNNDGLATSILNDDRFESLAYDPSDYIRIVKFAVHLDGGQFNLQFFDSKKFKLHVDYVRSLPQYSHLASERSERMYELALNSKNRKMYFGSLTYRANGRAGTRQTDGNFVFNIKSRENIPVADIIRIHRTLMDPAIVKISYLSAIDYQATGVPLTQALAIRDTLENAGIQLASLSGRKVETYTHGWSIGRLTYRTAADLDQIQSDEIVVFDDLPEVGIPPVRGIITTKTSAPSSHTALLAKMLSIPFVYINDEEGLLRRYKDQTVFFKPQDPKHSRTLLDVKGYTMSPVSTDIYAKLNKIVQKRYTGVSITDGNVSSEVMPNLSENVDRHACGAKAAYASLIHKTLATPGVLQNQTYLKNDLVDGLCIPFHYFEEFMKQEMGNNKSLRNRILAAHRKVLAANKSFDARNEAISTIKRLIQDARIDPVHIAAMTKRITEKFPASRKVSKIRLRSSSNAEDNEKFNGAGLYTSEGLKLFDSSDNYLPTSIPSLFAQKLERDLKVVWASVYGLRAYSTRLKYGLDEAKVQMGVLVNQSYKETARGVAIASFDSRYNSTDVEVIGFSGNKYKVVHAPVGISPETTSISVNGSAYRASVSRYSTQDDIGQGQKIMADADYKKLYEVIEAVRSRFAQNSGNSSVKVDLEWKRLGTGANSRLIVKQVRTVPEAANDTFDEPFIIIDPDVIWQTDSSVENYNKATPSALLNFISLHRMKLNIPATTWSKFANKQISFDGIVTDHQSGTAATIDKASFRTQKSATHFYAAMGIQHPVQKTLNLILRFDKANPNQIFTAEMIAAEWRIDDSELPDYLLASSYKEHLVEAGQLRRSSNKHRYYREVASGLPKWSDAKYSYSSAICANGKKVISYTVYQYKDAWDADAIYPVQKLEMDYDGMRIAATDNSDFEKMMMIGGFHGSVWSLVVDLSKTQPSGTPPNAKYMQAMMGGNGEEGDEYDSGLIQFFDRDLNKIKEDMVDKNCPYE